MQTVQTKNQTYSKKSEAFEFQNWEVYRRSVRNIKTTKKYAELGLTLDIKHFADQLTGASLSIPLNIAEGISRYGAKEKLNFLRIAKGSLFECVACIDTLRVFQKIDLKEYTKIMQEFSEIGKMLSGLMRSIQEREEKKREVHGRK